jgi:hypothetical protein
MQALAPATAHVALERYEHQPARAFCRPALNEGPVAAGALKMPSEAGGVFAQPCAAHQQPQGATAAHN